MAIKLNLFLLVSFLLVATSRSMGLMRLRPIPPTSPSLVKTMRDPPGTCVPPLEQAAFASPPKATPPPPPMAKPPTATPPNTPVAKPPTAAPPTPPRNTKECYPLCVVRCKLHSRQNVCLRACVTCCDRCKCVPPGQSGNKEVCGKCYTEMKTHGDRPKCP